MLILAIFSSVTKFYGPLTYAQVCTTKFYGHTHVFFLTFKLSQSFSSAYKTFVLEHHFLQDI
jgi:hypothetical protein